MEYQSIPDWIRLLKKEILKMDFSAHETKMDVWRRFAEHPEFPAAGNEVFKGWIEDRHLDWSNIELTLKLVPTKQRFRDRVKNLIKPEPNILYQKKLYRIANDEDNPSFGLKISFKKEHDQIKEDIQPYNPSLETIDAS